MPADFKLLLWCVAGLLALPSPLAIARAETPNWQCEGGGPSWNLQWKGNAIELRDAHITVRFKSVEAIRPEQKMHEHHVWLYQTEALGSRALPLTLIIQHSGKHTECWYSENDPGRRGHFVAMAITPGRVLVGCCYWREERQPQ
jgi:hypothetical protein